MPRRLGVGVPAGTLFRLVKRIAPTVLALGLAAMIVPGYHMSWRCARPFAPLAGGTPRAGAVVMAGGAFSPGGRPSAAWMPATRPKCSDRHG